MNPTPKFSRYYSCGTKRIGRPHSNWVISMKTQLARSTAGFALAVAMVGTANAQEAAVVPAMEPEVYGPTISAEELTSLTYTQISATDTDDEGDESEALIVPFAEETLDVPADLLLALETIEGNPLANSPITLASVNEGLSVSNLGLQDIPSDGGIVTLRGVDPFYGTINPFYGTINPFYGDIDAFWGDINPFYGDIDAFWGDIDAFWGDINPFYGDISAFHAEHLKAHGDFWQSQSAFMAETQNVWSMVPSDVDEWDVGDIEWDSTARIADLENRLNQMVSAAEAQFGGAHTAKTGNAFSTFTNEIFARHGIAPNDWESLARLSAGQQSAFFLDWHDSLNLYSGIDAVDHWMVTVNWTPAITQIQSLGYDSLVGIIDSDFGADADLSGKLVYSSGSENQLGGHGAGVASLIFASHDGEGVMGIAPNARVRAYNPFDAHGNAGWSDIGDAIVALKTNQTAWTDTLFKGVAPTNASVINLSLGEAGWVFAPGLAKTLYRSDVDNHYGDTVFVFAAGNDGITQTTDVEFNDADEVAMIFVGSVNPQGEISSFSNRPGSACLTDFGKCYTNNQLFMRTVVAPGELLLVSDGMGGVTRMSGTSFAAPLVSGAVTLLHSRWPWLTQRPMETAEIIFRSARDLGAPGPDEVYGWGLLDVAASQSPLNFNAMSYTLYKQSGSYWVPTSMSVSTLLQGGIPESWETQNAFFTGFESIGATYRDFSIPVSTFAYGKSTNALGRGSERLQDYIGQRFTTWINSGGSDSNGDGLPGFTELRSNGNDISGEWGLRYVAMAPIMDQQGGLRMTHGAATLTEPSGKLSFTVGHGQGAMALSGYRFGTMSDYDAFTGGVNPVLGFASGDSFAQAGYAITPNTSIRVGYSQVTDRWNDVPITNREELELRRRFGDRPAEAFTFDIDQRVNDSVTVGVQYTMLNEDNALLGTQTGTELLLGEGSQTEAMTVSASVDIGSGITLDVSATGARTQTSRNQLFTSAGSVWSTAGQFSATKQGILSRNDMLRVSVAQPLQIEEGALQFTSEQVIDRLTGETGPVTQTFGIETQRRIMTEAVYATPLSNRSQLGLFGRYVSEGDTSEEAGLVVGGNFSLRF